MKINKSKLYATLLLTFTCTTLTLAAGDVTIPHVFTSGETAVAADVNANFQALADAINALSHKVDQYTGADTFTPSPVATGGVGSAVQVDGFSYTMANTSAYSYLPGNNTQYTVLMPTASSLASTISTYGNNAPSPSYVWEKTTVNGYPTTIALGFYNNANATPRCSLTIKLDDDSYVSINEDYPGTVSHPLTKADQVKVADHCKALVNYVSVTAS